ncbi:MAG: DUF177 domain-containing protein [Alloprevotella sp.]|nr:DUF177 domain-containing protein [Alloprevotella sp.]
MLQTDCLTYRITGRADVDKRTLQLDNDFFASLPQDTIQGGDLIVEIVPHLCDDETTAFAISLRGTVVVLCDRCLEPVSLPIEVEEVVKVAAFDTPEAEANPDILVADHQTGLWNAAWTLYEICETSLPMTRVHQDGGCNADMLALITTDDDAS